MTLEEARNFLDYGGPDWFLALQAIIDDVYQMEVVEGKNTAAAEGIRLVQDRLVAETARRRLLNKGWLGVPSSGMIQNLSALLPAALQVGSMIASLPRATSARVKSPITLK